MIVGYAVVERAYAMEWLSEGVNINLSFVNFDHAPAHYSIGQRDCWRVKKLLELGECWPPIP